MKEIKIRIAQRMAWRVIDNKTYVFDASSSELHELNETATIVWLGIDRGKTTQIIANMLCDEFEVSNEIARGDVHHLIEHLQSKGLIE